MMEPVELVWSVGVPRMVGEGVAEGAEVVVVDLGYGDVGEPDGFEGAGDG